MNEFVIKNGFDSRGSGVITGSLTIAGSAGQTVLNTNVDTLDLSGSLSVTGSVGFVGSTTMSGTLVIAQQVSGPAPTIGSDAILFVSGAIGGSSKAVVGGDLVVSGALDAKTQLTASNFLTNNSFRLGTQTFYPQSSNGFSVNENFDASNSATQTAYHFTSGDSNKSIVFDLAVTSQYTTMFGTSGSAGDNIFVIGSETAASDFYFKSGLGIQPINLSGGTTLAKVTRNGDLEVTRNITATSATSTGSFAGDLSVTKRTTLGGVANRAFNASGVSGVLNFDMSNQEVFYVNGPTGPVTANFFNVPLTDLRLHTPVVVLSQSATPRVISAVQVNGAGQAINWLNGATPSVTANRQDAYSFSLLRSGSAWKVLGQLSSYG